MAGVLCRSGFMVAAVPRGLQSMGIHTSIAGAYKGDTDF